MEYEEDEQLPDFMLEAGEKMSSIANDADLAKGREMASRLATLDSLIAGAEERVKLWKEQRLEIARKQIPEFFEAVLHTDKIGVPEAGVDIVVKPFYHANIKSDWEPAKREEGFKYLEYLGHGDTIKVVVTATFGRGELENARLIENLIRNSPVGNSNPPVLEMSVPWNTLSALVKEQVEKGKKIDLDKLGATVGREAKVVKRK